MENSTKALLIAASILIVIVLISVGIKILSSTSGVTNEVGKVSDNMATSIFNSQFTSYFSNSTSGNQARALVQKIISNNAKSSHKILVYAPDFSSNHLYSGVAGKPENLSTLLSSISPTDNYMLTVNTNCDSDYAGGYDINGYLVCIKIDKLP